MKQLHDVQLHILQKLLYLRSSVFTDLKPHSDFPSNTFSFHIETLQKLGHISKNENHYMLTNQGKEYANRIEDSSGKIAKPQKITSALCCSRDGESEKEYVIYTRKKHPFYGKQGLFSGKIQHGELLFEGAAREMYEETGLEGELKLIMILHHIIEDNQGHILEDKYLHIFHCHNPRGVLQGCEEGIYEWVPASQIDSYITNPFGGDLSEIHSILAQAENFNGIIYKEERIVEDGF